MIADNAVAKIGAEEEGLDDTVVPASPSMSKTVAAPTLVPAATPTATSARTTQARTTVLPSFEGAQVAHQSRDRFKMVRVLGAGGMGEVSLAEDQDIQRSVALKYLHPNLADAGMLARFVEEIRTIGHLEHPNIVPIHDVGLDEQGRYFFVMKHLDGDTLETIIEKLRARDPAYEGRFPYERRAEIVVGILRALGFAHERGIIHRDIKPANVMVGKHGEVVLMDWGIAKSIGSKEKPASANTPPAPDRLVQTQMGSLLGTPLYMSPEQATGQAETMDARSDLYSVAVVLHELMSLDHYLHDQASLDGVLKGVCTVIPGTWPHQYPRHPFAPVGYLHTSVRGLQKNPAERFQSAEEMAASVVRVLDGVGDVMCPVSAVRTSVGHAGKFVDRRPTMAVFGAIGLSLLFATTTVISVITVAGWLRG